MSPNNPQQRKNYFIDKEFQSKFIFKFATILIVCMVIMMGVVYTLALHSTSVDIINSRVYAQSTADFILPLMVQTVFVVLLFAILVTALVLMYVSHRIAGPLFRYKSDLERLAQGDFMLDIQTRKDDQLTKLRDAFNDMIQNTRTRIKNLKSAAEANDTTKIKEILNQFKV